MADLLTLLQQQIEELSSAMCQVPGTLYMKSHKDEEVDVNEGVPDIIMISEKLKDSIDALPSVDAELTLRQENEIVDLWKERDEIEERMRDALGELIQVQKRLTTVNEALVIGEKRVTFSNSKSTN